MKKGFTIVECIIAILLLTTTVVGSMAFYFYSRGTAATTLHRKIATEIANAHIEDIKNMALTDYSSLISSGPTSVIIGGATGTETVTVSTEAGYKQVDLSLTWYEAEKTGQQEVKLITYIAPR